MFTVSTNKTKITPECMLDGNDPIQARMKENIITIKKSRSKFIKLDHIKIVKKTNQVASSSN